MKRQNKHVKLDACINLYFPKEPLQPILIKVKLAINVCELFELVNARNFTSSVSVDCG